jgi:L-histidine N-alpha-methyltransferase
MTSSLPGVAYEHAVLSDVRDGLARPQKELPPKYFYDRRGSELFEEITKLPEYYLTRAERRLLHRWMPLLMQAHPPTTLVELGAGSGEKTRIVLGAMRDGGRARRYVPIDVSADFLDESADRLRAELPWLEVSPVVADFTIDPRLPALGSEDDGDTLFAFLGSTIGNFAHGDAVRLLRAVRAAMDAGDRLLLGADLFTKPVPRIERAYNDAAGVTAEFNLNILRVLNGKLGADFSLEGFTHHAFWAPADHRIEMHLVARGRQAVTIPGLGVVTLAPCESIRTEICTKYDRDILDSMLAEACLCVETWRVDEGDQYAILIARPIGTA